MIDKIENGTRRTIDDKPCVYYDGHWIRHYEVESDDLATKKKLIDQLTKRVFHHLEPGINTPGHRLEQIREIYEQEKVQALKRVKGAMLAGALLNRGSDILSTLVDLQQAGVSVDATRLLLKECGQCFMEALELGKHIKLYSGEEGLDELWGEPFKMFSMPMEKFYESRYIKVANTMTDIDEIAEALNRIIKDHPAFASAEAKISALAESAKLACETIRSDPVIFEVWPRYVAAKESVEDFVTDFYEQYNPENGATNKKIIELIRAGGNLIGSLAVVRVPMPISTQQFLDRCEALR